MASTINFVIKEVPSWLIDWSNKVFLLLNSPLQVLEVFMDWVVYTSFTVSGNILTLVDAPVSSLFVDYTTWASNIVATSVKTFWNIKDKVRWYLWQTSNSTTFSDSIIWDKVNWIIRRILRGRYTWIAWMYRGRTIPWTIFRAWELWFMKWNFNIRNNWGSMLTQNLNIGDTVAYCDTTQLLPSWYVEIWGDTITYTNILSDRLEWVSWQTVQHLHRHQHE